jgi:hypothetical protein
MDVNLGLILREEHRLRVFENRMLRRIFGPKRVEHSRNGEDCIMRSFMIAKLTKYYSRDKIMTKMCGARTMNKGEKKCIQGVGNPEQKKTTWKTYV